jgi:hypothetical protein
LVALQFEPGAWPCLAGAVPLEPRPQPFWLLVIYLNRVLSLCSGQPSIFACCAAGMTGHRAQLLLLEMRSCELLPTLALNHDPPKEQGLRM